MSARMCEVCVCVSVSLSLPSPLSFSRIIQKILPFCAPCRSFVYRGLIMQFSSLHQVASVSPPSAPFPSPSLSAFLRSSLFLYIRNYHSFSVTHTDTHKHTRASRPPSYPPLAIHRHHTHTHTSSLPLSPPPLSLCIAVHVVRHAVQRARACAVRQQPRRAQRPDRQRGISLEEGRAPERRCGCACVCVCVCACVYVCVCVLRDRGGERGGEGERERERRDELA